MQIESHGGGDAGGKVVLIGGALTLISSISSVFFALYASGIKALNNIELINLLIYLVPSFIGIIYLILGFLYFRANISKSFENLENN